MAKPAPQIGILTIPLSKLSVSSANARKTSADAGISELAASIAAHGLRQNLNVLLTAKNGGAEVVAGQRRLLALQLLVQQGKLPTDHPIPCIALTARENPHEISLAENTMRQAMHPDDEYEAFNSLVAGGMPIDDVAARYGVTPAVVKQRMKLAAVSPKLRKLFRAGKMTLGQIMAFTLTDDVKKQEKVWRDLEDWDREDPDSIKAMLTENAIAATNKLARFVGAKAYEKAGGTLIRDLFDDERFTYFADTELLQQLATQKLEQAAQKLRAEGWGWVKASIDSHWDGTTATSSPPMPRKVKTLSSTITMQSLKMPPMTPSR